LRPSAVGRGAKTNPVKKHDWSGAPGVPFAFFGTGAGPPATRLRHSGLRQAFNQVPRDFSNLYPGPGPTDRATTCGRIQPKPRGGHQPRARGGTMRVRGGGAGDRGGGPANGGEMTRDSAPPGGGVPGPSGKIRRATGSRLACETPLAGAPAQGSWRKGPATGKGVRRYGAGGDPRDPSEKNSWCARRPSRQNTGKGAKGLGRFRGPFFERAGDNAVRVPWVGVWGAGQPTLGPNHDPAVFWWAVKFGMTSGRFQACPAPGRTVDCLTRYPTPTHQAVRFLSTRDRWFWLRFPNPGSR